MIAALLLLVPLSAPADTPDAATLAKWVADLASQDGAAHRAAHDALLRAGPKAKAAVPALRKLVEGKGDGAFLAVGVLGAIGPDAKEAVPAMLALLPKEGGSGFTADAIACAVARIDGAKVEATRILLLTARKGGEIQLINSQFLDTFPADGVAHLIALCADADAKVRAKAATVIATLKTRQPIKVPLPSVYERAGDAAKGIPAALEKLLADPDDAVRLAAAGAVTHVAPELTDKALAAVVALAVAADAKNGEVNAYAVFRPVPEKAVKVLLPLLDHDSASVRGWAVNNLVSLRAAAHEPVEGVLREGKSARARATAAQTLGGMYSDGRSSIPVLTTALADPEFAVRFAAAQALVHVGERASEAQAAAVPVLVEGLQSKDAAPRLAASEYLRMTGPAAKSAVPALTKLLTDASPEVRLEAAVSLVAIDAAGGAATVPALIEGLKLRDVLATRAAKALAVLGPVAKDAVPELLAKFDAKHTHLRLHAAEAAARIDPATAPKAVAVLTALLTDKKNKSSMVRSYGLVALRNIGPPAKPALPVLAELLKDDGPFHADVAVAMLVIDPESKPAREWFGKLLSGKPGDDSDDLYDVLEALPDLGPKAAALVPDLTPLLTSKVLFHRRQAAVTLGAIGPAAKAALPDLKALAATDPREDVRKLAAEAVKKIEG